MKINKKLFAAFIAGLVFSVCASLLIAAAPADVNPERERPRFNVNSRGQTYGSAFGLEDEDLPDLLAAENADGLKGYIRTEEAIPADEFLTPDEALRQMEELLEDGGTFDVDLYDEEGNVIGQMEIGISLEELDVAEITG